MKLILITFKDRYLNEFDINGFWITSEQSWDEYLLRAAQLRWPISFTFGRSENIDYSSYEEYAEKFKIRFLTKEEFKSIKDNIGEIFGLFPKLSLENDNYIEFG